MRTLMLAVVGAALVLSATGTPVSAQEEQASPGLTLWFHVGGGNAMWIGDLKEDPDHTSDTRYRNFLTWANAGQTVTDTVASRWTPESDMAFLPGQNIVMSLSVGTTVGWSATWGSFDVSATLLADGQAIATGPAQTVEFPTGTSAYFETLTWEAAPAAPFLSAGTSLSWVLSATGVSSDYVLSAADLYGHSHVFLPLDVPEPSPIPEAPAPIALEGVHLAWDGSHDVAHNATELYSWNNTLEAAVVRIEYLVFSGNASIVVMDANGTVVVNETVDAASPGMPIEQTVAEAALGNWSLHVSYQDFTGTLQVGIDPWTAAEPNPDPDAEPGAGDSGDGDSGKESPGPGLLALLALIAGVGIARRRRR